MCYFVSTFLRSDFFCYWIRSPRINRMFETKRARKRTTNLNTCRHFTCDWDFCFLQCNRCQFNIFFFHSILHTTETWKKNRDMNLLCPFYSSLFGEASKNKYSFRNCSFDAFQVIIPIKWVFSDEKLLCHRTYQMRSNELFNNNENIDVGRLENISYFVLVLVINNQQIHHDLR